MKLNICMIAIAAWMLNSCDTFLDKKPDIKLVVPKTIEDTELLLNDYGTLNTYYPTWGEIGVDDYFLTQDVWQGITNYEQRMAYIWADEPYTNTIQWQRPYKVVYISNQVLDILKGLDETDGRYKRIYGGAHFYRAFALHQLTEIYSPAYTVSTAAHELGIPLRLSPDIDQKSVRPSLEDTYKQIISDFKNAIANLPIVETTKGRPHRASAYGALARVFLDMGDFNQAYIYADSCLQLSPELLDFHSLALNANYPMLRFNVEVLFPALAITTNPLGATTALVDTILISAYSDDDLRKRAFFKANIEPEGTHYFKGSYDQSNTLFFGITTSEIYLVKSEAAARIGKFEEAHKALNTLLKSRWNKDALFIPVSDSNEDGLLRKILTERRKELVFRGRRWSDLKRLNLDPRFQTTLKRTIGDQTYTLPPNDLRYAYRIPETVIELSDVQQNKR